VKAVASPVRFLIPMAHVENVPASIAFYRRLGFEVENTFTPSEQKDPSWASLRSDRAQLMLARADEPVIPAQQAVLFYSYCDDVPALRELLMAEGIEAGPIQYPFYAPRGEFRIQDPDGYVIMVTHT
jgi:catechol 2,3-dioxygenase-like lactoylglutathione lyase family enzyme